MAALDVIVREAGGPFTSLDGEDGPWGGNALATNGHLHDAALSFLGSVPDDEDPDSPAPAGPGSVSELRRPRATRPPRTRSSTTTVPSPERYPVQRPVGSANVDVPTESGRSRMRIVRRAQGQAEGGVITITPDAGVRELLAALAEHNVGALIVSSDGETVDGIVSERDVVRHLHHDGTVVNNTVGAIMTAVVETCAPDSTLDELMEVMTERRIRHVPVVDDGVLVGIVCIGDVVKHQMSQLRVRARPARLLRPPDLSLSRTPVSS